MITAARPDSPRLSDGLTYKQWQRREYQKTEHERRYWHTLGSFMDTIDATCAPSSAMNEHAAFNRACALTRWAIAAKGPSTARTLARMAVSALK